MSFVAINCGSVMHELVVLPLPEAQNVGARTIGGDGEVSQTDSVGEASAPCGEGACAGIAPGASSWVRVTLALGHYELICNLPGHYPAGGYSSVTDHRCTCHPLVRGTAFRSAESWRTRSTGVVAWEAGKATMKGLAK